VELCPVAAGVQGARPGVVPLGLAMVVHCDRASAARGGHPGAVEIWTARRRASPPRQALAPQADSLAPREAMDSSLAWAGQIWRGRQASPPRQALLLRELQAAPLPAQLRAASRRRELASQVP